MTRNTLQRLKRLNTPALRMLLAICMISGAAMLPPTVRPQIGFVLGWLGMLCIAALREADQ